MIEELTEDNKPLGNTCLPKLMAEIAERRRVKNIEEEEQRKQQKEKYIDNDDYCPTLPKFEVEATCKKLNLPLSQYLQWLNENDKRYAKSAYYLNRWANDGLSVGKGEEHSKIVAFISKKTFEHISLINGDSNTASQIITLQSNKNSEQLGQLYKWLSEKKYIQQINLSTFVFWFSGENLQSEKQKIKWIGAKTKLFYLLEKLCINFSCSLANICIQLKEGNLDSNNRPKNGFREIDDILKSL